MIDTIQSFPEPNSNLGNYEIGRLISTNVFGYLYEAIYKGQKLILHVLPSALIEADEAFLENYRSTVNRLRKIKISNIALPVDIVRVEKYLFCHYDLEGVVNVYDLIEDEKAEPFKESWVREVVGKVGTALKACRDLEVGHFFLTPDFVCIDHHGDVKILGVGLLESVRYEAFEYYISRSISPFKKGQEERLTPLEILSPEVRDEHRFDSRSDFYGVGILCYLLLTGNKPVRNWTLPSKAREGIEANWDFVISHCLEPDPDNRYASWAAFLGDLKDLETLQPNVQKANRKALRRLEWIPLPEIIQKRYSAKLQMRIRLALLGLMGLVSIGSATLLLLILFEEPPEDIREAPIRRVANLELANLNLRLQPSRAKVSFAGSGFGAFVTQDGSLHLSTGRGRFQVKVEAPFHAAKSFQIVVDNKNEAIDRTILLDIPWVPLVIRGDPGTDVWVKSKEAYPTFLGRMDSSGQMLVNDRLIAESYEFIAQRPGYFGRSSGEVVLKPGDPLTLDLSLEPMPAVVEVLTQEAGVELFINEQAIGTAPLRIGDLAVEEELILEAVKTGYRTYREVLTLDPGEFIQIELPEFERKMGEVAVILGGFGESPNAMQTPEIQLGDADKVNGLTAYFDHPSGEVNLRVSHPDYELIETTVSIEDRAQMRIEKTLIPKPAQVSLGISSDKPRQVLVNGNLVENATTRLSLAVGRESEVEVRVRDHMIVKRRFLPKANEQILWEVPLREISGPEFEQEWNPPYFGLPMVWVPAGTFDMGSPKTEIRRLPNEDNPTTVVLTRGFWMGKFEVTQELYERLMQTNPSRYKDPKFPVDSVSWNDAVAFCRFVTAFEREAGRLPEGYIYRLPTEAEWEYVARFGVESVFHFGNSAGAGRGNFKGSYPNTTLTADSEQYGAVAVGSFAPNPLGVYDLHGNVAEWTMDVYWDRLPGGEITDYYRSKEGRGRSIRGGSWQDAAHRVRSAARAGVPASAQRDSIGFRMVLAPALGE